MDIKPLGKKILVERIPSEKKTSMGIILQSSAEPDRAKVLAIGTTVDEVSVGDVVLIDWNKATKIGNENFILYVENVIFTYQ
jgi:co-chaperonin GroES (HSP10)